MLVDDRTTPFTVFTLTRAELSAAFRCEFRGCVEDTDWISRARDPRRACVEVDGKLFCAEHGGIELAEAIAAAFIEAGVGLTEALA